jgi:TPR repeat protein
MKLRLFIGVVWLLAVQPGLPQTFVAVNGQATNQYAGPADLSIKELVRLGSSATNAWAEKLRQNQDWATVLNGSASEVREKAQQGVAVAQLKLGYCYWLGDGLERDEKEGVKWLTKASGQGLAPAQFILAQAYLKGLGAEESFSNGVEWLDKAANQEFADAEFLLGLCYLSGGPGVNQAPARGVKWLLRAAEQGKATAQQCVGECYSVGNGVKVDPTEAARWYARAAQQGLPTAEDLLAGCYMSGRGVTQDFGRAFRWYHQAAEQGLGVAQANLARCFARGTGVSTNSTEAALWWGIAATNNCPGALFHLGICYYSGFGVDTNFQQAISCFTREVERKHVGAELYLGLCYWRGDGVERDPEQAGKIWGEACIQGIVPWRYAVGDETLGDAEEVERWWREVASQASPSLQCCLAESYHFGHGVAQDDLQAVRWYRRAAAGGDLVALKRVTWLLSTSPDPKVRDGASAVGFGEKAAEATKNKDASILDTLAAAYAEATQFEKAVRTEKQAVLLAMRDQDKREYESRLKLYQNHSPYRAPAIE